MAVDLLVKVGKIFTVCHQKKAREMFLQQVQDSNGITGTVIAVAGAVADKGHAAVFVTNTGAWGLLLEHVQDCLCNSGVGGGGSPSCTVAMAIIGAGRALEAISGSVRVLTTSPAACGHLSNWVAGLDLMPNWFTKIQKLRLQLPPVLSEFERASTAILEQRDRTRILYHKAGSNTLNDAAFELAQTAAASRPSEGLQSALEQYFALYVMSRLQ